MRTPLLHELTIFGKLKDRRKVIGNLQKLGLVHVAALEDKDGFVRDSVSNDISQISALLLQLRYIAEQTGVTVSYNLDELPLLEDVLEESKQFVDSYMPKVKKLASTMKNLQDDASLFHAQLSSLQSLPFALSIPASKNVTKLVYESKTRFDFTQIREKFRFVLKRKSVEDKHYYIFDAPKKHVTKLCDALAATPLKQIDISYVVDTSDVTKARLQKQIRDSFIKITQIKHKLSTLLHLDSMRFAHLVVSLQNYHDQYSTGAKVLKTKNFFLLRAYCEHKDVKPVRDVIGECLLSVKKARKDAPTKFNQKGVAAHFKPITELFSIPSYRAVDPTSIIAFFYPFFFGFMLSDIGYGLLLLAIISGLRYFMGERMHTPFVIFSLSAISSVIFGLIFGSFFGNLIPITPLYADSFSASFTILKISLVIGLVHLNLGNFLQMYQLTKAHESFSTVFLKTSPFILLQLGAVFAFLQVYTLAVICGALLLVVLLKDKSFFGLMDITGFFGTWFSYARLLALSLATAGVALAINIIADKMLLLGKFGVFLWLLVLILGHGFNFVLNILGCSIHAARLHYVEFFSFFFEGEGHKFNAFSIKKKYGGLEQW